ncbi:Bestrophin, RFP-TM, chloride channel-domain-containing protein [Spinellus fusiger]|nr:Bestrophin, RFP-TM, chloride channel-domain-containing protein [Spinellus fusiger]
MTFFSVCVWFLHYQLKFYVGIPVSVLGTVSVALGLLLGFRVNTAYDRYWEGRKLVQTVIATIRNLTRQVWINIPEETETDHLEKMRCVKLLLAFMVATKHHLRHEYGIDYYDLEVLLPPNWVPCSVTHTKVSAAPIRETVKNLRLGPLAQHVIEKANSLPFVVSLHNSIKPPNHDEPVEADDPADVMNARRADIRQRFPDSGFDLISSADFKRAATGIDSSTLSAARFAFEHADEEISAGQSHEEERERVTEVEEEEEESAGGDSRYPSNANSMRAGTFHLAEEDQDTLGEGSFTEEQRGKKEHHHRFHFRKHRTKPKSAFTSAEDLPYQGDSDIALPIEILYRVALYINQAKAADKIESSLVSVTSSAIDTLINSLTAFERIVHTPIPRAYNIHLKQGVLLYIFFLPFALVESIGWLVAPVVALVSFTLFGIESIGAEIENPFGYDENDLPLNRYCEELKREVEYIIYYIPSKSTSILLDGQ